MTTINREPAVLPLSAILLDPPLPVRAESGRGGLKKGGEYYMTIVRHDGKVKIMGDNSGTWHDMLNFVEMLHPTPANDNAKTRS